MRAAETAIAPSRRGGSAQGRAAWVRVLRDVGYCGNAVGAAGQNNEPRRKAGGSGESKVLGGGGDFSSSLTRLLPLHLMRTGLLLHHLAMQVDVETFDLDGLADPE